MDGIYKGNVCMVSTVFFMFFTPLNNSNWSVGFFVIGSSVVITKGFMI